MDCFKIKGFSFPLDSMDLIFSIASLKPFFLFAKFCLLSPHTCMTKQPPKWETTRRCGATYQHIRHSQRPLLQTCGVMNKSCRRKPKGREVPVLRGRRSLSAAPIRLGRPLRHLNELRTHRDTHSHVATKQIRAQLSPRSTIIDHYTICSLLFQPL